MIASSPIQGAVPLQSYLISRDGVYELTLYVPGPTPLEVHDILHGPVTAELGRDAQDNAILTVQCGSQPPWSTRVGERFLLISPLPALVIRLVDSDTGQVVGERWRTDRSPHESRN